jgi:hypothetical protein
VDNSVWLDVAAGELAGVVAPLDQPALLEDPLHPDLGPAAPGAVVGEQGGDALHLRPYPSHLLVEGGFTPDDRFLQVGEFGVELGDLGAERPLPPGEGVLQVVETAGKIGLGGLGIARLQLRDEDCGEGDDDQHRGDGECEGEGLSGHVRILGWSCRHRDRPL